MTQKKAECQNPPANLGKRASIRKYEKVEKCGEKEHSKERESILSEKVRVLRMVIRKVTK